MRFTFQHFHNTPLRIGKILASLTAAVLMLSSLTGLTHVHSLNTVEYLSELGRTASDCGTVPPSVEPSVEAEASDCWLCQQQRRNFVLHSAEHVAFALASQSSSVMYRSWFLGTPGVPTGNPRAPPAR